MQRDNTKQINNKGVWHYVSRNHIALSYFLALLFIFLNYSRCVVIIRDLSEERDIVEIISLPITGHCTEH